MSKGNAMDLYAVLPLRDIVMFPGMIAPLFVGREKSIGALEDVISQDKDILLVTQKDSSQDNPKVEDLYDVGVIANVLQLLKLPDGTLKVLVEGKKRAKVKQFIQASKFLQAEIYLLEDSYTSGNEIEGLCKSVISQFERYVKLNKKISAEVVTSVARIENPSKLSDTVASHLALKIQDKQELLLATHVATRLEMIYAFMEGEIEMLSVEKRIKSRVKQQMEKSQKEYYLNEQLKAINKELSGNEGSDNEINELEKKIKKLKLSKEAKEKALSELVKLKNMMPMSAEATVIRNYLDWVISLPWKRFSKTIHDLALAQQILDEDHYGLKKVKERILEYLAVQQRTKKIHGPILCLVGPPGVGKTSLARSIARATGRNFVKMSLGGVHDESEIRGHRRTYVGSMPGKILQGMKKAKKANPLFLLDEIDKLGRDFRGDPASALLEVLDNEQNQHFNDHYLEVDYDLSHVMFVATANTLDLPPALLDRMEIIRISGYTEDEKIAIAKRHLIKKQIKHSGLLGEEWKVTDVALRDIIRYYTREAGVRNLERELANLTRKAIKQILLKKKTAPITVSSENLKKYAGVRRYSFGQTEQEDLVGVVNGLAYTETGGDLLTIECVSLWGKGNIKCTGKLGDVMQESAQAAFSYVRSRATDFGIIPPFYQKKDLHLHVPEGATPKDGPSAGVAMSTAIVSVLTGTAVKRSVAMTGEVTLRGRVLPIGGLKEKLLGALRGGIETVIIPKENVKDLEEIPEKIKKKMKIIAVSTVDEALNIALVEMPQPIDWVDIESMAAPIAANTSSDTTMDEVVAH